LDLDPNGLADPDRNPDPDPGRPKLSPKREKLRNFMFEEFSFGLELLLKPECPLQGFKKIYDVFRSN
jgi:hypothetical protein